MKSFIKQFILIALFIACAMVICSCSDLDDEYVVINASNNIITPQGGVLHALNGNVIISFPEGAVYGRVSFDVNTCFDEQEQGYKVRPIRIDPVMVFNTPVNVTLRYDEILAIAPDKIAQDLCLKASHWKSGIDFFLHKPCTSCDCLIDFEAKTISFWICGSGIITIEQNDE